MTYRPQNVSVEVLGNPNIINALQGRKVPAVIGYGPSTITVVDEAVVRGAGSTDELATTAVVASITTIANNTGVVAGGLDYALISANGALYDKTAVAINVNVITWTPGTDVPAEGDTYYVTYVRATEDAQFVPTLVTGTAYMGTKYGEENVSEGILAMAGNLVLENGSPAAYVVQIDADVAAYDASAYKAAIDLLQKKSDVSYVIATFPSGSVSKTQQEEIQSYLYTHTQLMNNNGRERGMVLGNPSEDFAVGGYDAIADYNTRSGVLKNENVTFIVPSVVYRSGVLVDSSLAAAAVAGVKSAQLKEATPIHGFSVTGITVEEEKWTPFEMNQLGAGSCLVLEQVAGIVTIRDAITTDPTSADTQEMSVVDTKRLVKKTIREGLANKYNGKGTVVTDETPGAVAASTDSILTLMVNNKDIAARGLVDNPLTGELETIAVQDTNEPRLIRVTCSYKPLYPLKWIDVTANVYV